MSSYGPPPEPHISGLPQYRCPYKDCGHVGMLDDFNYGKRYNECRECNRRVHVFFHDGAIRTQTW